MTRIGVLSDTHAQRLEPELMARLAEIFRGVELILHAGDLVGLGVLDDLAGLVDHDPARVVAVCGNMDGAAVTTSLPARREVKVAGRTIGLVHGGGAPVGLAGRVRREFDRPDAIVFGHSHRPYHAVKDGVLMFNPGSVSRGFMGSGTVGVLTLAEAGIEGEIVKL